MWNVQIVIQQSDLHARCKVSGLDTDTALEAEKAAQLCMNAAAGILKNLGYTEAQTREALNAAMEFSLEEQTPKFS